MSKGTPKKPQDVLMPAGKPIGTAHKASDPLKRDLPGGVQAARDLFTELTKGATPTSWPNYPGTAFHVPGGGSVGLRPVSGHGSPAIDINIPSIPITKIHFP